MRPVRILAPEKAERASRQNKGKFSDSDALTDDLQFTKFRRSARNINPPILTENGELRLNDSCDLLRHVGDSHRSLSIRPFGFVAAVPMKVSHCISTFDPPQKRTEPAPATLSPRARAS